ASSAQSVPVGRQLTQRPSMQLSEQQSLWSVHWLPSGRQQFPLALQLPEQQDSGPKRQPSPTSKQSQTLLWPWQKCVQHWSPSRQPPPIPRHVHTPVLEHTSEQHWASPEQPPPFE